LIQRKIAAPNIEDLRADIKRTEDVTETALSLSEFIQKKGDTEWIDPLIETLGPWALVQLSDLASLMEVIRKYELPFPMSLTTNFAVSTNGESRAGLELQSECLSSVCLQLH
jgi:hypothetical protein